MTHSISDFALKLVFQDWRLLSVSFTGLGIGGALIGHLGSETWNLNQTFILISAMMAATIIAKCISFAYKLYRMQSPSIKAIRLVQGDGLNRGYTLIVFSQNDMFSIGQLVTLFCESSGARQPILIAVITAVNSSEIQATSISNVPDEDIRKYFEEESRRRMLFATPEIYSEHMRVQAAGAQND